MTHPRCFFAAGLLAGLIGSATSQTTATQIHHEAKLALDFFGKGYAAALLDGAAPTAQLDAKDAKLRFVNLASAEMSMFGSSQTKNLAVKRLKLTQGDRRELGLQVGATPVDALLRNYGPPEKRESRRLVYRGIAENCVDHLVFHVGNGVLEGIEWDWCYD